MLSPANIQFLLKDANTQPKLYMVYSISAVSGNSFDVPVVQFDDGLFFLLNTIVDRLAAFLHDFLIRGAHLFVVLYFGIV